MEKFFVYYRREPTFRLNPKLKNFITRDFNTGDVTIDSAEYTFVGTQFANTVDDVFYRMQAPNWSPNGEAYNLITALGLQHTSMSVGDLLLCEDGIIYEADLVGWEIHE